MRRHRERARSVGRRAISSHARRRRLTFEVIKPVVDCDVESHEPAEHEDEEKPGQQVAVPILRNDKPRPP